MEVQFLDCGSQKTILSTVAPWFGKNIEDQLRTGFESSTTVQGFPAIERLNNVDGTSEIEVVIKDRFVVIVAGKNVELQDLRQVTDGLDLKKLESF
ncbi:MAG: hypothetical protein IPJ40_14940 [Saprospirales bacterium]|nr:hypothetical protein [Saprospirales bacterium]